MNFNRRRVINWILVVSLSLNLLVFGGITARILIDSDGHPLPPNLSWILDDLDEATLERLAPQLGEYRQAMWPLRGAIFRAQVRANELLTEEPLDQEALDTAFDALREAGMAYQEITQQQTIEIFAQITPAQRVQATSFMRERRAPDERRYSEERDDNDDVPAREPDVDR